MVAENTDPTPILFPEADINNHSGSLSIDDARWRRLEERQTLLWRLLLGALCGLLLQACWVCRLTNLTGSSLSHGDNSSAENKTSSEIPETKDLERKPAALLNGYRASEGKDNVLLWTVVGDGFLHKMDYKDGLLTIREEGYYFLYSKVAFSESHCILVKHTIMRISERYGETPMELMQSVRFYCPKPLKGDRQDKQEGQYATSSYLGGAFHLFTNDSVFVKLERGQIRTGQKENFFGAFLL
ncbi:tumor necrosis factor ligand superfamily member 14-like [Alosa sapidissima]|uniref:tumor necrosis factor ligand superfamily member 14-like n=1 Tax=Alosa sapidissima TaxID=34773 RepID=UPI001C09702B|nr:tumor necrosis factor ligand superfamily member 14-like [Alosa sapidissima]